MKYHGKTASKGIPPNFKPYQQYVRSVYDSALDRLMLMQHLDDLDDILEACDHMPDDVDSKSFAKHLKRQLPHLHLSHETVSFLFQQV